MLIYPIPAINMKEVMLNFLPTLYPKVLLFYAIYVIINLFHTLQSVYHKIVKFIRMIAKERKAVKGETATIRIGATKTVETE